MKDELHKNFGAPTDFNSGDPAMETTGAPSVPRAIGLPSELPSLYAGEYAAPASNLPTQVSQSQLAGENRDRWGNVGPADSAASAPMLSGTQVVENDNE